MFTGEIQGMPSRLDAGTYRSNNLAVPIEFDIPELTAPVRWSGVRDTAEQMIMALSPPTPVPGTNRGAVPGLGIAVTAPGLKVEDVVSDLLDASPVEELFLEAEPGLFLGREATIVHGELRNGRTDDPGRWYINLRDGSRIVSFAQGDRAYLIYVLELQGTVFIIEMNAHPEQLDLIITEGSRVAETIRPASSG